MQICHWQRSSDGREPGEGGDAQACGVPWMGGCVTEGSHPGRAGAEEWPWPGSSSEPGGCPFPASQ